MAECISRKTLLIARECPYYRRLGNPEDHADKNYGYTRIFAHRLSWLSIEGGGMNLRINIGLMISWARHTLRCDRCTKPFSSLKLKPLSTVVKKSQTAQNILETQSTHRSRIVLRNLFREIGSFSEGKHHSGHISFRQAAGRPRRIPMISRLAQKMTRYRN
jgi:hypothetical protein